MSPKGLWYTGAPLDRVSYRRKDSAWLDDRLAQPETFLVPVWRNQNLAHSEEDRALLPTVGEACDLLDAGKHVTLLGMKEGRAYFALDLSHHEDPYLTPLLDAQGAFDDLRKFGPAIDRHEGAILAHARGLMFWHARHQYCGVCGSPTEASEAGNQRDCINSDCKAQHFPRTDPAVIMLVYRNDYCLLGRSRRFPIPGMYSTFAGFVEPGETLEEAVAREVLEEVGITCLPQNVHYWASQPWPFPASLMLGFHAEAEGMELVLQDDEIEDAKWLHRLQMDDPESVGVKFPRRDSIAYRLIHSWMDGDMCS